MRVAPDENCLSRNRRQIDRHDADGFIVACILKEPEKRSTRDAFNDLRREKLSAESTFLGSALILEIKEDRVQGVSIDAGHVPGRVDIAWFALCRNEAATHENAWTASIAQQAQGCLELRQLLPSMNGRAEAFHKIPAKSLDGQLPAAGPSARTAEALTQ